MTPRDYDYGGYWPKKKPRRPGPGPKRTGRSPFGSTWWGREWVGALEGRARLDPNRLPRGKTYARQGAVGDIDVSAGEVSAPVQGSRRTPYQVRIRVRLFTAEEWSAVFDALACQAGHAAALLEGEIPPEVAGDVQAVGLDLLPGPGELQPRCSCPDWADPCKHSAAVCYLVADLLDADPFALFLLRGKSRPEIMAELRGRRMQLAGAAGEGDLPALTLEGPRWEEDAGVAARDAWAREVAALPAVPVPPRRPGQAMVLATDSPEGSGIDGAGFRVLAADAARRAWALAADPDEGESALELTFEEDLARWAEMALDGGVGAPDLATLASRSGISANELFMYGLAWQAGGCHGLATLTEEWDPAPAELAPGRALLGPGARAVRNRVSRGDRQLRLGRDGRWYPYRKTRGVWHPDGEAVDPRRSAPALHPGVKRRLPQS